MSAEANITHATVRAAEYQGLARETLARVQQACNARNSSYLIPALYRFYYPWKVGIFPNAKYLWNNYVFHRRKCTITVDLRKLLTQIFISNVKIIEHSMFSENIKCTGLATVLTLSNHFIWTDAVIMLCSKNPGELP